MRKIFRLALTVALLCTVHQKAFLYSVSPSPLAQGSTNAVPNRVVIPGVPFVSWNDAAHLEVQGKDVFSNSGGKISICSRSMTKRFHMSPAAGPLPRSGRQKV